MIGRRGRSAAARSATSLPSRPGIEWSSIIRSNAVRIALERVERLAAVATPGHRAAEVVQQHLGGAPDHLLVLREQHVHPLERQRWLRSVRAGASGSSVAGRSSSKRRALARRALVTSIVPPMRVHGPVRGREPEPVAVRLGREEGLEDATERVGRDADAGVAHAHAHVVATRSPTAARAPRRQSLGRSPCASRSAARRPAASRRARSGRG